MVNSIKLDKEYSNPFGVPFHTILNSLDDTTLDITQNKTEAIIKSKQSETFIKILKPDLVTEDNQIVSSVITIKTKLPKFFDKFIDNYDAIRTLNRFSSLGAITLIDDENYIGTRLTMYEGDNSWNLHIPLITMTVLYAELSIIGALEKLGSNQPAPSDRSHWQPSDFKTIEQYLSKICVCNSDDNGFTAEFPLTENATSAGISGKMETALLTLKRNENHLALGGGLFSLLSMPHNFENQKELFHLAKKFNQFEMQSIDLVPHYGAWTTGNETTLSYVSFLPNLIYEINGTKNIAVNLAIWSSMRANSANKWLAAEGIYI